MSDTTTDLDDRDLAPAVDNLHSVQGAVQLIEEAIDRGLEVATPVELGDYGMIVRGRGGEISYVDVREWEDEPRLPPYIRDNPKFVSVDSLSRYVDRHQTEDSTVAYIVDTYGKGSKLLTSDNDVAWVTFDDHPAIWLDDNGGTRENEHVDHPVGRQAHKASLVLRPTEQGKRWGQALAATALSQEAFLDLIDDGIGEIADPDGAVLRDLVSDLHAIRTAEVQSVVRTGGEGTIMLKENVSLHGGTGAKVTFPESMTVTFTPFVGVTEVVVLKVRIKPEVAGNKVTFGLRCAALDAQLAHVMGAVAAEIAEHTGLNPLWKP